MQEKLIEHWLDSVNERNYQAAFLQMLSGEGHQIIHSTRHMSIEFGKDVISLDESGIPCAFQLKGNPGSRLTLTQFREIRPQITELIEQPIVYAGISTTPHKCYLVTNGEIEEEVQRAVDDLNTSYERRKLHENSRLNLISRGTLLKWAVKHATSFWGSNFAVQGKLIKFYNESGTSPPNLELLSQGLDDILVISASDIVKSADLWRRQISAALFVAFATKNYAEAGNHIALAGSQAALFAALAASETRHNSTHKKTKMPAVSAAREAFVATLVDFSIEVGDQVATLEASKPDENDRDYNVLYLEGSPLSDHFLWRVRALKTAALLSILNLDQVLFKSGDSLPDRARLAIDKLTVPGHPAYQVWGEAAIPQLLAHGWNWRNTDPTFGPNFLEINLLREIFRSIENRNLGYIASPYYSAEEAVRDAIWKSIGISEGKARKETQGKSSYFAEALFQCFVRANVKSDAKLIWPKLTRILHKSFIPDKPWQYCLWECEKGENLDKQLPTLRKWQDVQIESGDISTPHIPIGLREDPIMLLAFIVFFPHRALPEVIRYLQYCLCQTWFLPFPRPGKNDVT